jgi:hypothetical protein
VACIVLSDASGAQVAVAPGYQGRVNSYNDGPPAPGKAPLGPFYELETSLPALSLAAGESYTHVHRTYHFAGSAADLDTIARATLKVGVKDIVDAFDSSSQRRSGRQA